MALKLRKHQLNAKNALAEDIRGIINLPTGTGKTLIQSRAIVDEILNNEPKVYVILSPRILLSNQLLSDVRKDLIYNSTDAQYLIVHSGRTNGDLSEEEILLMKELDLPLRGGPAGGNGIVATTSKKTIISEYERSVRENVSLVISGTYHSAERIKNAGIPVEIVFCDEAHYLVQEQFSWIVRDPFPSNRSYYFTATLRETPSENGMGMNNTDLFGEVLYQEVPAALISKGEMVRPRMHMVDMSHDPEKDEADGLAVAEAFEEHRSVVVGAKLLVVSKDGSTLLDALATHSEIMRLKEVRPSLKIFDISSAHGARIDGQVVRREQFLSELRSLTDRDEAIIIHHDILSEGIDVPGITGVMPLITLKKAKFLQTLGRATRLHIHDRERLYKEELLPDELRRFIKPYAWLIVPVYGEIGDDLRDDMKEMVRELRDHGFNPSEDIVVRQKRGKRQLEPISVVNEPTRAMTGLVEFSSEVLHEIEEEEKANELYLEQIKAKDKISKMNVEELVSFVGDILK